MIDHRIHCNVLNCVFNQSSHCEAQTVEVGCDRCMIPNSDHETCCCTFRLK